MTNSIKANLERIKEHGTLAILDLAHTNRVTGSVEEVGDDCVTLNCEGGARFNGFMHDDEPTLVVVALAHVLAVRSKAE